MKLLTIVIPTYNMERYLSRCLESLLIKTSLLELLEIIIVNDGSKDHSIDIALTYREKYPNVFVVIDKPNGNYGSCVNRGLEEATGKYFRILDADDFFDTYSLSLLVDYIRKLSDCPDMIITNYQEDYSLGKNKVLVAKDIEYGKIYHQKELDFRRQSICVMHGITYKTEVLRIAELKHQEGISYTDSEYCFYPLMKVQTVVFLNIVLYHYQIGRDGQTVSEKSYIRNINQVYMILDRMLSYIEKNIYDYPEYVLKNQKKILLNCLKVYYSTILTNRCVVSEDLLTLENRILALNESLYCDIEKITWFKLPIVKIWRKTGFSDSNKLCHLILILLKLVRRILS